MKDGISRIKSGKLAGNCSSITAPVLFYICIDAGGTFTLPRLVGHARALKIAAFDEPISPEQALA